MPLKRKIGLGSEVGQILLVVVLAIIVASTVGLSLASRSITSLRTSTEEAESRKALSAAEAGIERAIQSNAIPAGTNILSDNLINRSQYSVDVQQINGTKFLINGGNPIPKDEGADVWFVPHNSTTGDPDYTTPYPTSTSPQFLNLYWGSSSDGCGDAAIQVIIVARNSATDIKSYRYVYDACPSRKFDNKFSTTASAGILDIDGETFNYRTPLNSLMAGMPAVKNIVLMRVIPIYKDEKIGIYTCNDGGTSCATLPLQGNMISSTGISGQANSKLRVFNGYPQTYLPYLSYGLFVAK
jgi:hypothetical protein